MWQLLGHDNSIAYEAWPTYDEAMLVQSTIEMAVQVNGKLRAKITVNKDEDKKVVEDIALSQENVKTHTEGKEIAKVIVVPNKIVNIVVK